MKCLFIIQIFFLFCSFKCISQNTWEFNRNNDEVMFENINHSLEYIKGSLVSISTEVYQSNDPLKENLHNSNIFIQDLKTGEIVKESHYSIDTLSVAFGWIFYNEESKNFIIAGEAHNTTLSTRRGYFILTKWDSDLNFISDTLVKLEPFHENNVIWILTGNHKKENEWVIIANYNDNKDIPVLNSKLLLIKIKKEGKIEKFKYYHQNGFTGNHTSIFFDDSENQYILFRGETYFLNTDFEKVDSLTTLDAINYYSGLTGLSIKFNQEKYLVSARFGDYEQGLAFFNKNLNFVKGIKILRQNDTYDFTFSKQNFDYIDTSEIYFGVQDKFLDYFAVAKVNSNLEPYWIKYYSVNDELAHYAWNIIATSDGGCVVAGSKGSLYSNPLKRTAWAIKLDANGNTVSTKDPGSDAWEITVFPNPSSGDFKIDISGQSLDAKLLLFDIQGREVKRYTDLHTGTNTFIFDKLPQGTYIWKLLTQEKEIGDGKWVKLGL